MTPLRRQMIDDMALRNLAPKTIESCVQRISGFARYFKTSPEHLGPDQDRLGVRSFFPSARQLVRRFGDQAAL